MLEGTALSGVHVFSVVSGANLGSLTDILVVDKYLRLDLDLRCLMGSLHRILLNISGVGSLKCKHHLNEKFGCGIDVLLNLRFSELLVAHYSSTSQ